MTDDNITARLDIANDIVKKYALASMGAGLIPVPIMDLVALSGVQLKMLHSLAELYEIPFTNPNTLSKSITGSLLGGIVPAYASGSIVSSITKIIPAIGTATGMASMAVFGGAATYAIGKVFIQHFESGGTFLDFDPNKVREHFAAEFEKGKEKVKEFQEQQKT